MLSPCCILQLTEFGGAPVQFVAQRSIPDREHLFLLPKLVAVVVRVDVALFHLVQVDVALFHLGQFSPVLLLLPLRPTVLEPDLHLLLGHLQEPVGGKPM